MPILFSSSNLLEMYRPEPQATLRSATQAMLQTRSPAALIVKNTTPQGRRWQLPPGDQGWGINNYPFAEFRFWQGFPGETRLNSIDNPASTANASGFLLTAIAMDARAVA
jgi:hypothetical protein